MEQIKVFATTEAYEHLTNPQNKEHSERILKDLREQITNKRDRTPDSYHSYSLFGISARWTNDFSQPSFVLIYYSTYIVGLQHNIYPNKFWEDIAKAIPLETFA